MSGIYAPWIFMLFIADDNAFNNANWAYTHDDLLGRTRFTANGANKIAKSALMQNKHVVSINMVDYGSVGSESLDESTAIDDIIWNATPHDDGCWRTWNVSLCDYFESVGQVIIDDKWKIALSIQRFTISFPQRWTDE